MFNQQLSLAMRLHRIRKPSEPLDRLCWRKALIHTDRQHASNVHVEQMGLSFRRGRQTLPFIRRRLFVGDADHAEQEWRSCQLQGFLIPADALPESRGLRVQQVLANLVVSQRQQADRAIQLQLGRIVLVLSETTADDNVLWPRVLLEAVDGVHTRVLVLRVHFIQTVEQRHQQSVLQPRLAVILADAVLDFQMIDEPDGERPPILPPRRQVAQNGHRLGSVLFGARYQFLAELEQCGGFPRPWRTEDEELAVNRVVIEDLHEACVGAELGPLLMRDLDVRVPGPRHLIRLFLLEQAEHGGRKRLRQPSCGFTFHIVQKVPPIAEVPAGEPIRLISQPLLILRGRLQDRGKGIAACVGVVPRAEIEILDVLKLPGDLAGLVEHGHDGLRQIQRRSQFAPHLVRRDCSGREDDQDTGAGTQVLVDRAVPICGDRNVGVQPQLDATFSQGDRQCADEIRVLPRVAHKGVPGSHRSRDRCVGNHVRTDEGTRLRGARAEERRTRRGPGERQPRAEKP